LGVIGLATIRDTKAFAKKGFSDIIFGSTVKPAVSRAILSEAKACSHDSWETWKMSKTSDMRFPWMFKMAPLTKKLDAVMFLTMVPMTDFWI